MRVRRLNRVELVLPGEDIPEAARTFNAVLGGHLLPPVEVVGQQVVSTTDYALGIELYGPSGADSPKNAYWEHKQTRGAIGPLVFEVDDLDVAKRHATDNGFHVKFEFGEPGARQVHLDPTELFGYVVTFTERKGDDQPGEPPTNVVRFQRVELLLPGEDLEGARQVFNRLFASEIPPLEHLEGVEVLTTIDLALGIELFGPASTTSPAHRQLERKGRRGAIGPLVWEVDDLDATKEGVQRKGYRIQYEYGDPGFRQIHLDPEQLFGYGITFTERRLLADAPV